MATVAKISYSDGSTNSFRYPISALARYLKRIKKIERFREVATMPAFPWLLQMAMDDASSSAVGREVTHIEIREKVK